MNWLYTFKSQHIIVTDPKFACLLNANKMIEVNILHWFPPILLSISGVVQYKQTLICVITILILQKHY